MSDDFDQKSSELLNTDSWRGFLGIKRGARYLTQAGVSSLYSEVYFLTDVSEDELSELPDYILSDTLQKDFHSSVWVCALGMKNSRYFPGDVEMRTQMGAIPDGEREGLNLTGWKDFDLKNVNGDPLYSEEVLQSAVEAGESELGAALWIIVKDICDGGGFLSQDWYRARIVYEYFRFDPVPNESAYLIGELFKELCAKQQFEGDLAAYYRALTDAKAARSKGASATREKAEFLRTFCVDVFVDLYHRMGPRLLLSPDETKAEELMRAVLERRPDDFQRAGKPYRKEWFLRNVIEDRRLDIAQAIEAVER